MSHLTADQILFLAFFTPLCFGSGAFLIIRDLPAVRRFCGEA